MAAQAERYAQVSDNLIDHPKTTRLSRALRVHRLQIVGHLACLWNWVVKMAPDGDLARFTARDLADAARYTDRDSFDDSEEERADQFLCALVDSGFVDRDGPDIRIHGWAEYGGRLQAERDRNARKQAEYRARSSASENTDQPHRIHPQAAAVIGAECNGNVTVTPVTHNRNPLQSRAEQSRAERSVKQSRAEADAGRARGPTADGAPALPAFGVNADSALPLPAPDHPPELLTPAQWADLQNGPGRWTVDEIRTGLQIVRERGSPWPKRIAAYLHSSILPEVRAGKRPNGAALPPARASPTSTLRPPDAPGVPPPASVRNALRRPPDSDGAAPAGGPN